MKGGMLGAVLVLSLVLGLISSVVQGRQVTERDLNMVRHMINIVRGMPQESSSIITNQPINTVELEQTLKGAAIDTTPALDKGQADNV